MSVGLWTIATDHWKCSLNWLVFDIPHVTHIWFWEYSIWRFHVNGKQSNIVMVTRRISRTRIWALFHWVNRGGGGKPNQNHVWSLIVRQWTWFGLPPNFSDHIIGQVTLPGLTIHKKFLITKVTHFNYLSIWYQTLFEIQSKSGDMTPEKNTVCFTRTSLILFWLELNSISLSRSLLNSPSMHSAKRMTYNRKSRKHMWGKHQANNQGLTNESIEIRIINCFKQKH